MILSLSIQNYAIIDDLEFIPDQGLTIITGETGAGKSILLGALGLIMGNRADSKVLFNLDRKCVVEGKFQVADYGIQSFFDSHDLDYHDELILRREINTKGKSRAFVNDTPVKLDILKKLSSSLVDMHQQFDTLGIQEQEFQIKILDALSDHKKNLEDYRKLFLAYNADLNQLKDLKEQSSNATKEMDFLLFQLKELEELNLKEQEQENIEDQLALLENSEALSEMSKKLSYVVYDAEPSLQNSLLEITNNLGALADSDQAIKEIVDRIYSIKEEIVDLTQSLSKISEEVEYDEEKINQLRERQNNVYRLLSKHNLKTGTELLAYQNGLQLKTKEFSDLGSDIPKLEKSIATQKIKLTKLANALTTKRKKAAKKLEKNTMALLAELSMSAAKLKIEIVAKDTLSATGLDQINFLFASNVGSSFQALKEVASGGEMSRLSLCIKSIIADAIALPTMIFDEIDTGVSGEVSLKMGKILKQISKNHQTILITHSPPIAAQADRHFFIYKDDDGKRTYTHIKELDPKEKIFEIAKMMSGGDPPSKRAFANAEELILDKH